MDAAPIDSAMVTAILSGLAALIIAVGSVVKSNLDYARLKQTILDQGRRIEAMEKDNTTLRARLEEALKENDELRDQNKVLAAVNEEYRVRLLGAIRRS
jgi:predicted nuclease with TOPRIM domain